MNNSMNVMSAAAPVLSAESTPAAFTGRFSDKNIMLQAKLSVGAANDPLEAEADAVAEKIMCMPAGNGRGGHTIPRIQKKCAACEEEEEQVQRKDNGGGSAAVPDSVYRTISSAGSQMDPHTQQFMESRFDRDFSNVQIHTDAQAQQSARSINALAYTVGNHVVFGNGQYAPSTTEGKKLLAHELTHVVQQDMAKQSDAQVQTKADSEYTKGEALAYLRHAITTGATAIADGTATDPKINILLQRVGSLYAKLRASAKNDASDVDIDFDPDPKKNEIKAGDSDKSIDTLYGSFKPTDPALVSSASGDAPAAPAGDVAGEAPGTNPDASLMAKAGPGGLTISPAYGQPVQRFAIVIVGIIILGGLLVSGCNTSTPADPNVCSPADRATISARRAEAGTWISTALTKLNAVSGGTAPVADRDMVLNALEANFHTRSVPQISAIAARLTRIQGKVSSAPAECRHSNTSTDMYSYTNGPMYFCEPWFTKRDQIRNVTTIIHEGGHIDGLSGTPQADPTRTEDIYEFHPGYATMSTATALLNTEPYAVLARQIHHNGAHPPGSHR